jgi:hypothetical protein
MNFVHRDDAPNLARYIENFILGRLRVTWITLIITTVRLNAKVIVIGLRVKRSGCAGTGSLALFSAEPALLSAASALLSAGTGSLALLSAAPALLSAASPPDCENPRQDCHLRNRFLICIL